MKPLKPLKPGNQNHRTLTAFYHGERLHRFDAEKIGVHALHSLVSALEKTGLRFDRQTVSVPTRWGDDAHVALYWLAPESRPLAARLLGLATLQNPPQGDAARAYLLASTGSRA